MAKKKTGADLIRDYIETNSSNTNGVTNNYIPNAQQRAARTPGYGHSSFGVYEEDEEDRARREYERHVRELAEGGQRRLSNQGRPSREYTEGLEAKRNADNLDVSGARNGLSSLGKDIQDRIYKGVEYANKGNAGKAEKVFESIKADTGMDDDTLTKYITDSKTLYDYDNSIGNLTPTEQVDYYRDKLDKLDGKSKKLIDHYMEAEKHANLNANSANPEERKLWEEGYGKYEPLKDIEKQIKEETGWTQSEFNNNIKAAKVLADYEATQFAQKDFTINEDDPQALKTLKAARNWATGVADGTVGAIPTFLNNTFNKDNPYSAAARLSNVAEYGNAQTLGYLQDKNWLGTTANNAMEKITGQNVAQTLYGASQSAMTSAITATVGGLAGEAAGGSELVRDIVGFAPFFASGYNSQYKDARDRGLTNSDARTEAFIGGAAEVLTEKISMDRLWDMAAGKKIHRNILVNALAQAGIEGSEEVASNVINTVSDMMIAGNDGKSKFDTLVNEVMSANPNMSEREAEELARKQMLQEVAADAVAGFISGGMSGSGAAAVGVHNANRVNTQAKDIQANYTEALKDENLDEDTRAKYERYAENPYQKMADDIDASNEEGAKAQEEAQKIADEYDKKGKASISDRAYISGSIDVGNQAADYYGQRQNAREQMQSTAVPEEYRNTQSDITENEARKELGKAARSGDTEGMVDVYQQMKGSTSIAVRQKADEIFNDYSAMARSHGADAVAMEEGKASTQDAYLAGLRGEELDSSNTRVKEAYNAGQQARIQEESRRVVESKDSLTNVAAQDKEGHAVTLTGEVVDGKLVTNDGKLMDRDSIQFEDNAASRVLDMAVTRASDAEATAYISNISDNTNIELYNRDFMKLYKAGQAGLDFNGENNLTVDQATAERIYNAGVADQNNTARIAARKALYKSAGVIEKGTGLVTDSRKNGKGVNDEAHMMADVIASVSGLNMNISNIAAKNGQKIQAEFNPATSTITVSPDSVKQIFHEVGEFVQFYNAEGHEVLRKGLNQAMQDVLGAKEYSNILDHYQNVYAKAGDVQTSREITSEMTNDMLVSIMGTKKGREALAKYLAENTDAETAKKYENKITTLFHSIADGIRSIVTGNKGAQQKMLERGAKQLEGYADEFIKALDVAIKNYQSGQFEELQKNVAPIGLEVDAETESVYPGSFSVDTWNESDYVAEKNKAAKQLAEALGVSEKKALKYIDNVNSIAKIIADDRARLDYEANPYSSAFVSNVEYGGSIDFSTICKKRLLYTGTLQEIQKQIGNRVITMQDYLDIRNAMLEDGLQTTCGCCYVEGSRAKLGQYMEQFIKRYAADGHDYVPTMYDVTMPDGIRQLKANHPEVYAAREYFLNHMGQVEGHEGEKNLFGSQGKPKDYTERTAYRGEILDKFEGKAESVAAKNLNGGLRLQSFSDFEIVNLIDCMQVIMDMSRCGLAGQAYTKVYDFADALGNTGLKINLSLMAAGVDANGNLILDEVNGMKQSEAMELRDKYSKNVGTIIVCFTDEQIKAAMASDYIDYIIPFHRSQWRKSQYEALGLPEGTKDYTMHQNDRMIKDNGRLKKADRNFMPNEYWDFSKTGRENAQTYIDLCNNNNLAPKFAFLLDKVDGKYVLPEGKVFDGYFKLLIDFKMYDNDGVGSPQMPVQPNFSMDECARMLNEYTGGHDSFPVAQEIADRFADKIKARGKEFEYGVKHSVLTSENYEFEGDNGDVTAYNEILDEEKRLMLSTLHTKYMDGTEDFEISHDNKIIIPISSVVDGDRYSEIAFVSYDGYVDRVYKIGAIAGGNIGRLFDIIEKNERIGIDYGRTRRVAENLFGKGCIYRYTDSYNGSDEESYGWTEEGQMLSDKYHSEYLQNRERDAAETFGAEVTIVNGRINLHFEDDTDGIVNTGEDVKHSVAITDSDMIKDLENQEHITTYRSFLKIGDKLYAPMASMDYKYDEKTGKKVKDLGYESEIGQWEQATENIDVAKANYKKGKFKTDKKTGREYAQFDLESVDNSTGSVAYNPYLHSSNLVLNDQFSAAYRRNLVVVECEVPVSEAGGKYHAELAKDSTGWKDWKSGAVASAISKQKPNFSRQVFLSRYMKPVRVLDFSEVAQMYKDYLDGTNNVQIPWNVVPTELRHELEKIGVPISYEDTTYGAKFSEAFPREKHSIDIGYHAGDLGKAESLFQQSGGRDTGHYGTGTYFVGDEAELKYGYSERPHWKVDFSKYNLLRPSNYRDGRDLHEFLKAVNYYYDLDDNAIRTEEEWEDRRYALEDKLWEDDYPAGIALEEAKVLFGKYDTYHDIVNESPLEGYGYSADGIYDFEKNRELTDVEVELTFGEDTIREAINRLIYDNRYAPRYVSRVEDFDSTIDEVAQRLFGISGEEAAHIINEIRDEIREAGYDYNSSRTADSASTRFIKRLGYEGIDVRGIDGLDNTTYGSVIYDLKGEDLDQKIANGAKYSVDVNSEGKELTANQSEYFKDSKARDEQGRLKVFYHGTRTGGFTTFNMGKTLEGFFFSDAREVGEGYAGTEGILNPDQPMSFEELSAMVEGVSNGDEELTFVGGKYSLDYVDGEHIATFDTLNAAQTYVWDNELKDSNAQGLDMEHTYATYLDMKNPYVVDLEDGRWENFADQSFNPDTQTMYGSVVVEKNGDKFNVEYRLAEDPEDFDDWSDPVNETLTAKELRNKFGEMVADQSSVKDRIVFNNLLIDNEKGWIPNNTGDVAWYAQKHGYDGAIVNGVVDPAGDSDYWNPSTVAIVFNSNQIKSVFNENPTSSDDMRYSIDAGDLDIFLNAMDSVSDTKATVSILQEGIEALKHTDVRTTVINSLANKIKKDTGSHINTKTLVDNLTKAFAYMQNEDYVDYNDMLSILDEIARPIIDQAEEKQGEDAYKEFVRQLKGFSIKLTDMQKKEVASVFGSYGAFRSMMMPLNISDNGGTTLEAAWGEIVEASGYVLDYDTVEGDMPMALYDTLTAMRPTVVNSYGADADQAAHDLALRIIEDYFTEAGKQEAKGKAEMDAQAKLKAAAEKMRERNKDYRAKIKARYDENMKHIKAEAKYNVRWRDAENNQRIAEIKAKNRQKALDAKERQACKEYKEKISKRASELYKWISEPTEAHHVPTSLVYPVGQFLTAMDFVEPAITQNKDGLYTINVYDGSWEDAQGNKHIRFKKLTGATQYQVREKYYRALTEGSGSQFQRSWQEKMRDIQDIFLKVANGEQFEQTDMDDFMHTIDPTMADQVGDLLSRNSGLVNINQLSSKDLRTLNNALRNVISAINKGNKAYTVNESINDMARQTIESAEEKQTKEHGKIFNSVLKFGRVDNLNPKVFLGLLGKSGKQLYKGLRRGLNTKILDIKKAGDFMRATMDEVGVTQKEINSWGGATADIKDYHVAEGTLHMTDAQVMGLYETMKRTGAMERMAGGIIVDEIPRAGVIANKPQSSAIHLTFNEMVGIVNSLSDKQKAFADKLQKYMAVECSKDGNEVSEELYGYEKFLDPTYYPWSVDRNTVASTNSTVNVNQLNGIERSGFTKSLTKGAINPLVISDILDVFTDHVSQMAAYHGYAAANKDVLRWLNYRQITDADENGFRTNRTTKEAINKLTGANAGVSYINKLLMDINGSEKSQYIGNFTDRLMGNYKAAAVGANLRVVIQQPTAYFRALNLVDAKYLLTVNPIKAVKSMDRVKEQSAIAWWKSQGYYETAIGKSVKEMVTGQTSKVEAFKDKLMAPAGLADDVTWSFLYLAIEKEQRALHKGVDAEEFRQLVNDRFDEVVDSTQVVDSTLHRSQFMRSKDKLNVIQTAFMAEPTKSYNMLVESVLDELDGQKRAKVVGRAAMAYLLSNIATSAASAIMDAFRYDTDDDDWGEVWWEHFLKNAADNVNPFNLLPIVKDVSAAFMNLLMGESSYGNSSSRFDLDAVNSLVDTAQTIAKQINGEGNKTAYGMYMTLVRPISQITGIPLYNLSRDSVALYNAFFEDLQKTVKNDRTYKQGVTKAMDHDKDIVDIQEEVTDSVENHVAIKEVRDFIKTTYKEDYQNAVGDAEAKLNTEGYEDAKAQADAIAELAAKGLVASGMTDEEADAEINDWLEEAVGYAALDKAIKAGDYSAIMTETENLIEFKDEDKIEKHIYDKFGSTVEYERANNTDSDWEGSVDAAFLVLGTDYDITKETLEAKAAKAAEKKAAQAVTDSYKDALVEAIHAKDLPSFNSALSDIEKNTEGKDAKDKVSKARDTAKNAIKSDFKPQIEDAYAEGDNAKAHDLERQAAQYRAKVDDKWPLQNVKDAYAHELEVVQGWTKE